MKIKPIIIINLFFLTFSLSASGNADQLVKLLQNKFNSISDLSADFRQSSNGKVTLAGKFFYGRTNKMRLELKNLVIVSDGVTNWSYNKKENKVIISNYNPDDPSIISLQRIINEYPLQCKVTSDKDGDLNILNLFPNKSGLIFKNALIYINPGNLIQKINLTDQTSNHIQIEFSNYQLNKSLGISTFSFTPPKGSKVIDLR
ncbi:MAG: outer-membrane lipoprotein carrier protein LolA [Ignavibacteriaceae bacterium]|jgi:outer membrane lipoprotein carrier protein